MLAEEFIPPSMMSGGMYAVGFGGGAGLGFYPNNGFEVMSNGGVGFGTGRREKNGFGRRRNMIMTMAQREDVIRRTVYDHQVYRLKLVGDYDQSTGIVFVEFIFFDDVATTNVPISEAEIATTNVPISEAEIATTAARWKYIHRSSKCSVCDPFE